MTPEPDECALCHLTDRDVRDQLVAWADWTDRPMYDFLPRCRDRDACRARVEAAGERWPVREAVTA